MGSIEEERLLQMVYDFIESESSPTSLSTASLSTHNNHVPFGYSTRCIALQNILMKQTEQERSILERVGKHMKNKMDLEKTTKLKQWLVKCLQSDGFHASLTHNSCVISGCPCGNYEYIEVTEQDARGVFLRLIVDIDFKSQFEVARPTQSYTELSNKLPIIFVGNEEKLKAIISLLCPAAQESLKERGLHIPPWRRATYMQSKWKLLNCPNSSNKGHEDGTTSYSNSKSNSKVPSIYGQKWSRQAVGNKGNSRRDVAGGGSGLSNQFSGMRINCC